MIDSHQNLVKVRRSSGQKEWMTIEKLESLNEQRALRRKKFKKPTKQRWSRLKISLCVNALSLIPLEAVITNFLVGLTLWTKPSRRAWFFLRLLSAGLKRFGGHSRVASIPSIPFIASESHISGDTSSKGSWKLGWCNFWWARICKSAFPRYSPGEKFKIVAS